MLKGMIGKVALLLRGYQDEGDVLLYTAMSSYIHIREIGDPRPAIPNCRGCLELSMTTEFQHGKSTKNYPTHKEDENSRDDMTSSPRGYFFNRGSRRIGTFLFVRKCSWVSACACWSC